MSVDRLSHRVPMPVQAAGLSLLLAGMQLGCRNTPNPSTAASTEVYSPGSVESATYQIGNQPIKLSLPVALPDELTRIHANIGNPSSEFDSRSGRWRFQQIRD